MGVGALLIGLYCGAPNTTEHMMACVLRWIVIITHNAGQAMVGGSLGGEPSDAPSS
jgi:hypothetical protein